MVRLIDKTKISTLDYLYMFFIIIYAAQASAFVRGLGDPLSVGNIVAVLFTIVMIITHKVKFSQNYFISIFVLILYTVLTFVRHNYVSGGFIPRWFIYLSIAYVICQIYGLKIFAVIESVLLPLFIISLIMWVLHISFPSLIYSFVERFSLPTFSKNINYITYNCIFYTINGEEDMVISDYFLFRRNAGFAWEPGAYACFACLAIACSLIRNPNKLLDFPVIIYLAAIFTSQSTTGAFIVGGILLTWTILNKKILWAIVLIPVVLYVAGFAFITEKFMSEYTDVVSAGGNINNISYQGRLFGLEASWYEFIHHPFIGLGGKQDTYLDSMGIEANIFSGLGSLITTFGLLLSVPFFIFLFKSEKVIRNVYNNNNGAVLIVVLILSMISYQLWRQPLFLALTFMSLYEPISVNWSNEKIEKK